MSKRCGFSCGQLRWVLLGCLLLSQASWLPAQENKTKEPEWKYGWDLKARKAGEKEFSETTQKYGVEAFLDPNTNKLVYISGTGSIAVVPPPATFPEQPKEPKWLHAMDLRVRKAGQGDFDKDVKKFGVEVYRDENTGNLVYLCETGAISVIPGGSAPLTTGKEPEWKHALELPVRKANEVEFSKTTNRYSLEVFRDENAGNLVYVCETGSLAVVPGTTQGGKVKSPDRTHAVNFKVRNASDLDFNDKTPKYGVECFLDTNTNKLVYITETGSISVPAIGQVLDKPNMPEWLHGMNLKTRKVGDKGWETAKKFGVEIYLDGKTGSLLYISETVNICALPK